MTVVLTRQAVGDIEQAHDHYTGISVDLGTRFVGDLDAAIDRITTFPRGAPPVEGFDGVRRARMRQFPYGLFYRPNSDGDLVLLRVLHSRRQQSGALDE